MRTTTLLFRPIDVLHFRGNRLFGGPGDHGEAIMPPWPSVFIGAVISRSMADRENGVPFADLTPEIAHALIEEMFGEISLRWMALADETSRGAMYFPSPADIVLQKDGDSLSATRLVTVPRTAFPDCGSSFSSGLPEYPVLRSASRTKAAGGYWFTLAGFEAHLAGKPIDNNCFVPISALWKSDPRLGIAIDSSRRTAEKSRIYTTEAIALADSIGFVCSFSHEKGDLPRDGLVRLGGDGRAAEVVEYPFSPDSLGRPASGWKRFRMILATPCPSETDWLPPGIREVDSEFIFQINGMKARLMSAAVARYEVISGWDLAKRAPKPAVRMIPAGAVYWFETIEGDTAALEELWQVGLPGSEDTEEYPSRRREGFGRVWFGVE